MPEARSVVYCLASGLTDFLPTFSLPTPEFRAAETLLQQLDDGHRGGGDSDCSSVE